MRSRKSERDQPKSDQADLLQEAFHSFDQAAGTLQQSYRALTARLERLDLELATSNDALRHNLKENERMRTHLAAILESLSTGVIVADEAEIIVRCNQAAIAFLGRPRGWILGRRVDQLMQETQLDLDTYPVVAPSGALLSITRNPLHQDAGDECGSIVLLHDITRLRQLEERLQRRDRLAGMGEMVGRIAHEIRNPLGSVELFASMLKRDLGDQPERRAYAEHICMSVRAMDRLLSNLLVYTRPAQPNADWHGTEALVLDALTLAAHAIAHAPIEIPLRLDPEVPQLWCDANQMKQVLLNLILNAIQAMPDGGTLMISASYERDQKAGPATVRLAVSDTGLGIDPAHRSRLFDPFFTTKEEGTGLGLAIADSIVEAHGGRLEVESPQEQGTTFTILLPAEPQKDLHVKVDAAEPTQCIEMNI